jgi:hypothetical protein
VASAIDSLKCVSTASISGLIQSAHENLPITASHGQHRELNGQVCWLKYIQKEADLRGMHSTSLRSPGPCHKRSSFRLSERIDCKWIMSGDNPFSTYDSTLNCGSYSGGSSADSELHSNSASLPQFRSHNSLGSEVSRLVRGIMVQGCQGQDHW